MHAESKQITQDILRELRVLIVDDNPGDRFLYKQLLVEEEPGTQFSFEEAGTGAEALERYRQSAPHCVLLDYLLPDMLGIEILKEFGEGQKIRPLPVVMLTGFGDEATAVNALQNGAHGYLAKRELTGPALSRAVDRAVRDCANQRKLEESRAEMAARNRDLEQKYSQIDRFYQKTLGRLQRPVRAVRDRVSGLAATLARAERQDLSQQFRELQAECERLVVSVGNLVDGPGVNLGQLLISTQPASIIETVSETINTFRPAAEAAGVRLSVRVQPGLPEVPIDRYRIEQVLCNLLDNAIRHTPARGQVCLNIDRLPQTPEEITISVSDTGAGMAPDRLNALFERQLHDAAGGGDDSPGVGLRVCKEIVRAHGGWISAESLPEAGTRITFSLPLEERPADAAELWDRTARAPAGCPTWHVREPRKGGVHRAAAV